MLYYIIYAQFLFLFFSDLYPAFNLLFYSATR